MLIRETILLLGGSGFLGKNILDFVIKNDAISNNYKFIVLSRNIVLNKIYLRNFIRFFLEVLSTKIII